MNALTSSDLEAIHQIGVINSNVEGERGIDISVHHERVSEHHKRVVVPSHQRTIGGDDDKAKPFDCDKRTYNKCVAEGGTSKGLAYGWPAKLCDGTGRPARMALHRLLGLGCRAAQVWHIRRADEDIALPAALIKWMSDLSHGRYGRF